jgi:hypothetical protein
LTESVGVKENMLIKNRTEGTRAGPPEVLRALMEGGPVDPSQYWFHLHVKIETGHEKYRWMNNRVIVGRATRAKGEVAYDAFFLENPSEAEEGKNNKSLL